LRHSWLLLAMLWIGDLSAAGPFAWVERSAAELEFWDGGKTVFVYGHGEGRDCCYLAPLVSPQGVVLTDGGPVDHPHHRGVFWAWPVAEVDGKRVDLWTRKGIEHRFERIVTKHAGGEAAGFEAEHSWVLDGVVIVRDSLAVTAKAVDGAGRRTLEIQLTVEAADASPALPRRERDTAGSASAMRRANQQRCARARDCWLRTRMTVLTSGWSLPERVQKGVQGCGLSLIRRIRAFPTNGACATTDSREQRIRERPPRFWNPGAE